MERLRERGSLFLNSDEEYEVLRGDDGCQPVASQQRAAGDVQHLLKASLEDASILGSAVLRFPLDRLPDQAEEASQQLQVQRAQLGDKLHRAAQPAGEAVGGAAAAEGAVEGVPEPSQALRHHPLEVAD